MQRSLRWRTLSGQRRRPPPVPPHRHEHPASHPRLETAHHPAKMALRATSCHAGGRGFESRRSRSGNPLEQRVSCFSGLLGAADYADLASGLAS
jgi:hypothetical protein